MIGNWNCAVHESGIAGRVQQRRFGAGEHRNVGPGDFAQFQCVAHRMREADVAGGDREADDVMRGRREGHQECQCIVHAGIGVDEKRDAVGHSKSQAEA